MPAIWSDRARQDTRDAALRAGFGSRDLDSVIMISEPEAAALCALKAHLGDQADDPLKKGEHVLICDCGGGTVVSVLSFDLTDIELSAGPHHI